MKMKWLSLLVVCGMVVGGVVRGQDVIISNNFDNASLQDWKAGGGASLYSFSGGGGVHDYSTSTPNAANLPKSGGNITLTEPMPLATRGYTSVTISFSWQRMNATTTRFLVVQYSSDGVNYTDLARHATGSNETIFSGALTLNKDSTHSVSGSLGIFNNGTVSAFTDSSKFRITDTSSSGVDTRAYVDDIVITASPAFTGSFWDSNSATAGAGIAPNGTWGTDLFWSASDAGDVATGAWTTDGIAVFSAGSDATGAYTVTVDGTQDIGGISFADGTPTLTGGTLNMTSASPFYVGPGLTATVASSLTGADHLLTRTGTGQLILSGDNSGATGGMELISGITQFENAGAINGSARNITINTGAVALFGSSFGDANIPAALLDRIVAGSTGTVAADNYASTDFNFSTAGLTAASLGSVGAVNYTGTFTPNGSTYRLGGGGGTLTLNTGLNSANSLVVVGPGTLQLNGYNTTVTALSNVGTDAILENGGGTDMTLTVTNASASTYSGVIQDGAGGGTLSLVKSGAGTLTLSGANAFTGDITIGGGALTFSSLNAWGGSGKNVTFAGSGTLTSTADGYSGGSITVSSENATYNGGNATFSSVTGSGALVYSTTIRNKVLNIGNASSLIGTLKLKYNGNLDYQGNTAMQFSSLGDGADSLLQFESGGSNSGQGVAIVFNGSEAITFNYRQVQFLPRTTSNWSLRDLILKNNSSDSAAKWVINTSVNNRSCRNHNFVLGGSNVGDNEFAGVIGDSTNGVYYSTQTGILSLQKVDAGRWILSGQNTYTGTTTVSGGTLVLRGEASIADTGTLNITGGKVEIETKEAIAVLQINGTPVADGIWGTMASGAPNVDDDNLSGTGKLYVGVPFPPSGTVLILR